MSVRSVSGVGFLLAWVLLSHSAVSAAEVPGKRLITVEDCVETRRFERPIGQRSAVLLSPDGRWIAYLVKMPDVASNRNNLSLYVRVLLRHGTQQNGTLVARHDNILAFHWLADSHRLVILSEDNHRRSIQLVNTVNGTIEEVPARGIVDWVSVDASGNTIAYNLRVPRIDPAAQANIFRYGAPILIGRLLIQDEDSPFQYSKIIIAHKGKHGEWRESPIRGALGSPSVDDLFESVRAMSLSPDGKLLIFSYMPEAVPPSWRTNLLDAYFERDLGYRPQQLVLYNIGSHRIHSAFDAPQEGWSASVWSADSRAFAVASIAPIGSVWEERDRRDGFHDGIQRMSYDHLFAVDAATGQVSEVLQKLPLWDEIGIALWPAKDRPMLIRVSQNAFARMKQEKGEWVEASRIDFRAPQAKLNASWSTDGKVVIAIRQGLTTPPDLLLYDIRSEQDRLLTNLNPAYERIALAPMEPLQWTDKYGQRCSGFLIRPVSFVPGRHYPLVIMSKNWTADYFYSDTFHRTAFAPQPLAAAGFMVLMPTGPDSRQVFSEIKGLDRYPGQMGEAYSWMAMVESAIQMLDSEGLIDPTRVGIQGFSRSSWYVDFMLTHNGFKFAAASSADGGLYNYGDYWLWTIFPATREGEEHQMGGPPYGKTLANWLQYSPAFNADKVTAPLLMEYTRGTSNGINIGPVAAYEFFNALKRQDKPVELFWYPRGQHELDTPDERVASLRRNLEWFRFWILREQDQPPAYDLCQYVRWRDLRNQRDPHAAAPEAPRHIDARPDLCP